MVISVSPTALRLCCSRKVSQPPKSGRQCLRRSGSTGRWRGGFDRSDRQERGKRPVMRTEEIQTPTRSQASNRACAIISDRIGCGASCRTRHCSSTGIVSVARQVRDVRSQDPCPDVSVLHGRRRHRQIAARLLSFVMAETPHVRLRLVELNGEHLESWLETGTLDFAKGRIGCGGRI